MDALEEIGLLLKAAHRAGEQRINDTLRPLGITAAQAEVLHVLDQSGPLSLGELGGLLIAEGGHPSRLVERMAEAGLIDRKASSKDQRRLELRLTRQGRKVTRQVQASKQCLLAPYREQMHLHDLNPLRTILESYLEGSPWLGTVQARRRLADQSSPK